VTNRVCEPFDICLGQAFVIAKNKSDAIHAVGHGRVHAGDLMKDATSLLQLFHSRSVDNAETPNAKNKHLSINVARPKAASPLISEGISHSFSVGTIELHQWIESNKEFLQSFSNHQELRIHKETAYFRNFFFCSEHPVKLSDAIIQTSLAAEHPKIRNHVIIATKRLASIYDLVRPLRAKYLGSLKAIVILYPGDIPVDIWRKLSGFRSIFFVRGSAVDETNLVRAGIFKAAKLVMLASGSDSDEMTDTEAIFAFHVVRKLNPKIQIVAEIVNHSNYSYLEPHKGVDPRYDDFRFSSNYASGNIFATASLDSFVCQVIIS
jgi:hypothetical protein